MNSAVFTLAVAGTNLYAGGTFTQAGGSPATNIARWNGSTWSALGSGTDGTVYALAFDSSGYLYAGGSFTAAGSVAANYIARWNGSSWSTLGNGTNGSVFVIAVDGLSGLYAGGDFYIAGGAAADNIARWNGRSSPGKITVTKSGAQ